MSAFIRTDSLNNEVKAVKTVRIRVFRVNLPRVTRPQYVLHIFSLFIVGKTECGIKSV